MKKLKRHFFLPEDQHLFDYDQIFSVSSMWIELGMEKVEATYDLYVRGMPKNRNFLIFAGLEEILESIKHWKFGKKEIDFLLENKIITPKMAKLLEKFRFKGDIWAMKEGTIFFPNEPVVRITGPLWQINLFTFFLMNALTSNTIFASKIVRSYLAAEGKVKVVTCPVTRAHSNEASLKFGRAAYILGAPSAIVPAFARKFDLPMSKVNTKAYHAFINSFPTEIEAMRAATKVFPTIGLMVDTYGIEQGIKNAIIVAKETKEKTGKTISAIIIDSGKDVQDYARQAEYARKELDKEGLQQVKITVAGNFEEKKIAELVKTKAPVDGLIACTDLVTSSDDPKMEAVLKLAEFIKKGKSYPTAKLSPGKESFPGKKQVFRKFSQGKIAEDILGLEKENLGQPLLQQMMKAGKLVYQLPTLDEIKEHTQKQLETLPTTLRQIATQTLHPVKISNELQQLFETIKQK